MTSRENPDKDAVFPALASLDDGHVELGTGRVVRSGRDTVVLPARELALLRALVAAPTAVGRDALAERVAAPGEGVNHRSLDHLVFRLRAALEAAPESPTRILTERARGYRWVHADPAPAHRPRANVAPPELVGRTGLLAWLRDLARNGRSFQLIGCPGNGMNALKRLVPLPGLNVSGTEAPIRIMVPPLDADDALALFQLRLAEAVPGFDPYRSERQLRVLAEALGGHPWSICRLAARAALIPIPTLLNLSGSPVSLLSQPDREALVQAFRTAPVNLDPSLVPEPLWSAARARGEAP